MAPHKVDNKHQVTVYLRTAATTITDIYGIATIGSTRYISDAALASSLTLANGKVYAKSNISMVLDTRIMVGEEIEIASGSASDWQKGADDIKQGKIEYSFDKDVSSLYHSTWGSPTSTKFPVELVYNFRYPSTIDYIIYTPRKDGNTTGRFGKFELWLAEGSSTNFVKYGDFDFNESGDDSIIEFLIPQQNIYSVKFIVKSVESNTVSCAEMNFYTNKAINGGGHSVFDDDICTALRLGVSDEDVM